MLIAFSEESGLRKAFCQIRNILVNSDIRKSSYNVLSIDRVVTQPQLKLRLFYMFLLKHFHIIIINYIIKLLLGTSSTRDLYNLNQPCVVLSILLDFFNCSCLMGNFRQCSQNNLKSQKLCRNYFL